MPSMLRDFSPYLSWRIDRENYSKIEAAPVLSGTESIVIPKDTADITARPSYTFAWRLEAPPSFSSRISALPDYFVSASGSQAELLPESAVLRMHVLQKYYVDYDTRTGAHGAVTFADIGTTEQSLVDALLVETYGAEGAVTPTFWQASGGSVSVTGFVPFGTGNPVGLYFTNEIYLFVDVSAGFYPFLETSDRVLVTVGDPSGQRAAVWGSNWIQRIENGGGGSTAEEPIVVESTDEIVDSIEAVPQDDPLVADVLEEGAKAVVEVTLAVHLAAKTEKIIQSGITKNPHILQIAELNGQQVPTKAEIFKSAFDKAGKYVRLAEIGNEIRKFAQTAYEDYRKNGELGGASALAGSKAFAAIASGYVGGWIGGGAVAVVGGLTVAPAVPFVVGVAVAGVSAYYIGNKASDFLDTAYVSGSEAAVEQFKRNWTSFGNGDRLAVMTDGPVTGAAISAQTADVLVPGAPPPELHWTFNPETLEFVWLNDETRGEFERVMAQLGIGDPVGLVLTGDQDSANPHDLLMGGDASDQLNGGNGDDVLIGADGHDSLSGDSGADVLQGGGGNDRLNGGSGRDTADFSDKSAPVIARLNGANDIVVMVGGRGEDTIRGVENILGGSGADRLTGDGLANTFMGFGGADTLSGQRGDDRLDGGAGADRLDGGQGNDRLIGGVGKDSLTGGSGNDVFRFLSRSEGGDRITDFSNGAGNDDLFHISAAGFGGGLKAGALPGFRFQIRSDNVAQDADDRFIFRTTDRTLWFDPDGKGGQRPGLVADLQATAMLGAADILLI